MFATYSTYLYDNLEVCMSILRGLSNLFFIQFTMLCLFVLSALVTTALGELLF